MGSLVGAFESQADAINVGYQRFGNVPFLVKQVVPVEVPQNYVSNHLGIQVPLFTVAVPNLQAIGPIVEIRIAVPAAVEAIFVSSGQPVPSPVAMAAMIDTRASGPSSQAGVAARLGLHPAGVVAINTPSSTGV